MHEILVVLRLVVRLASAPALAALALVHGEVSSPGRKAPALCILWELVWEVPKTNKYKVSPANGNTTT